MAPGGEVCQVDRTASAKALSWGFGSLRKSEEISVTREE